MDRQTDGQMQYIMRGDGRRSRRGLINMRNLTQMSYTRRDLNAEWSRAVFNVVDIDTADNIGINRNNRPTR